MKRILYITISLILVCGFTYAQNIEDRSQQTVDSLDVSSSDSLSLARAGGLPMPSYPKVIPLSPQSQLFNQYINHEITEYNGLPEINIPLCEVEIKGVKIPITLSYHAGGIKYRQYDGDVGVGWSINAGGYRVTRSIHGKEDEIQPFYNKTQANQYLGSSIDTPTRDAYLGSIVPNEEGNMIRGDFALQDGEYDMFTYQTPTSNGHFIITDRTTRAVDIAEDNQDKILIDEGLSSLNLNHFKLIDDSGNTYSMGKYDNNTLISETNRNGHKTTWPVTKIANPYGEAINFTYQAYSISYSSYLYNPPSVVVYEALHKYLENGTRNPSPLFDLHADEGYNSMIYVTKIETENVLIEFVRYNTGDLVNHFIKEIHVKDKLNSNAIIKKIIFTYQGRTTSNWHCLLKSVKVNDQLYQFAYYPTVGSRVENSYPDQWGYYSNTTNSNTNSNALFLHQEFKDDEIMTYYSQSISEHKKLRELSEFNTSYFQWINRNTTSSPSHYFSLKTITFPTGGTTEYIYEPNQYKTGLTVTYGGGQRIQKIISKTEPGATAITTLFRYGQNNDGNGTPVFLLNKSCYGTKYFYFTVVLAGANIPATLQAVRSYCINPVLVDLADFNISYSKVNTYQYINDNIYNGHTESMFDIPITVVRTANLDGSADFTAVSENLYQPLTYDYFQRSFIGKYIPGFKPVITSRTFYDSSNNKIIKEAYQYVRSTIRYYEGIKVKQRFFFDDYSLVINHNYDSQDPYYYVNSFFDYGRYTIEMGARRLLSKTVETYTNNANPITETENYEYYANYMLKKYTTSNSNGNTLTEEYTYPTSGTLYTKNMISTILETIKKNGTTEIARLKNNYSGINPSSVQSSYSGSGSLMTDMTFNTYDARGNLVNYTRKDGVEVTYIWGYNYTYPVAEIVNATYAQVKTALGNVTPESLSSATEPNWTKLNNLRTSLTGAMVTIYKYQPLVGVKEIIHPDGRSTHYIYDSYKRLSEIKEGSNVIERYNYNYKNN